MTMLKIETDRGYGWQVRAEGEVPAGTTQAQIEDQTRRCALNGPARAWLDGELVFECKKLTAKQGRALTIRSPSTGLTRRTFIAKEWGVVHQQDETAPAYLYTFKTEAKARAVCAAIGRDGAEVHYVERLEVVA